MGDCHGWLNLETWATGDNNKNMKDKREGEGEAGKREVLIHWVSPLLSSILSWGTMRAWGQGVELASTLPFGFPKSQASWRLFEPGGVPRSQWRPACEGVCVGGDR